MAADLAGRPAAPVALTRMTLRGRLCQQAMTYSFMPDMIDLQRLLRLTAGLKFSDRERLPWRCRLRAHFRALASVIVLLTACTTAVLAEVRVQGDAAALRLDGKQSQVAEILAALGPAVKVRVRGAGPLDRVISGTYRGSLQQVLSYILKDYNYILKTRGGEVEVQVYGQRGARAIAPPPPKSAPTKSLAGQWRSPITPVAPQQKP
jgi:hypothetical protein